MMLKVFRLCLDGHSRKANFFSSFPFHFFSFFFLFFLRSSLGLQDAVNAGDVNAAAVGRRIILPSSYLGGPRSMHQLYQDAMSIVRAYSSNPDYFITFTCNPKWPEITSELFSHQTAVDRPDLTARVFHIKLQELLDDLLKK